MLDVITLASISRSINKDPIVPMPRYFIMTKNVMSWFALENNFYGDLQYFQAKTDRQDVIYKITQQLYNRRTFVNKKTILEDKTAK